VGVLLVLFVVLAPQGILGLAAALRLKLASLRGAK
jgi:hypothetical protein